jgi:hypothetical protein
MYWRSVGTDVHRRLTLLLSKGQAAVVGLCLLSALALFTRFWAIDHKSLWLDEAVSWRFANVSLTNMFDQTAHDVHPPLYYGVLHYWVGLAGNSEASLRAPSAIFGAATIVLLAIVAWKVGGWLLALAASLLLLSNGVYLAATQEARMYPLVGLLTLASSVALASFIAKPSILRFVPYAALDILLIYTHYSCFIAIGIQGLVFGVYGLDRAVRNRNGWVLVAGLVLVAVLALAYIPWWSTFLAHPRPGGGGGYPQVSVTLVTDIGRSVLGLDEAKGAWLALALPLLLLGLYGLAKRWRDPRVLSVGAIALVPVGQILVSMWLEPVLNLRQVTPYIPGLAFVCALGFVEAVALSRRLMRFAPAGYAAVLLAGVATGVLMGIGGARGAQRYRPPSQDWRAAAAHVKGAPVVIGPGYEAQLLEYYRGSAFGVTPLWSGIMAKMGDGYVPIPRASTHSETVLILEGYQGHAQLPIFKSYFEVDTVSDVTGITTYRLRPLTTSEYNVGVFGGDQAPGAWITTPDGLLQTASDTSYFWLLSPSDNDHANGVVEDYTVHIEYLDRGPPSFTLVGLDQDGARYTLKQVPIDGTGEWKAIDVPVEQGSVLAGVFSLTSGVTVRTLEMRRYQLVGVDAPRSSADPARQWFLRTDGFLESVGQTACVTPTEPSAGAAGVVVDFTWLYAGRWVDSTANPAPGGRLCLPVPSPSGLIVRRVALRPAG